MRDTEEHEAADSKVKRAVTEVVPEDHHHEDDDGHEKYLPIPSEMLRRPSETLGGLAKSNVDADNAEEDAKGPSADRLRNLAIRDSITSEDPHFFPLPEPKQLSAPTLLHTIARASVEARLRERGYQLGRLLGEGSYAKVYLTEFWEPNPIPPDAPVEKQILACKVIDEKHASKNFLARFLPREITMLLRVNHNNVVRIHSMLKIQRKFFFFMHYCDNGDILRFIREHGVVREDQAKVWFSEMLDGLEYLHDNHIAHRDLKCENLLLDKSFHIKIGDFGFARIYNNGDEKSRTFCGSLSYAPPEVIHGDPYNPLLGDLWSIGIVLFIMLNKSMPFDDTGTRKMYESQMNRSWKFRHKIEETLSVSVREFIYLLLEPVEKKRIGIPQIRRQPWFVHRRASFIPAGATAAAGYDGGRRRSTLPRESPLYSY